MIVDSLDTADADGEPVIEEDINLSDSVSNTDDTDENMKLQKRLRLMKKMNKMRKQHFLKYQ